MLYIRLKPILPMLCSNGSHPLVWRSSDGLSCIKWGMFSATRWFFSRCLFTGQELGVGVSLNPRSTSQNWAAGLLLQHRQCSIFGVIVVTNYNTECFTVRKEHSPDVPKYLFSFLPQIFYYAFVQSGLAGKGITNTRSMGDFWNLVLTRFFFCSIGSSSHSC